MFKAYSCNKLDREWKHLSPVRKASDKKRECQSIDTVMVRDRGQLYFDVVVFSVLNVKGWPYCNLFLRVLFVEIWSQRTAPEKNSRCASFLL